MSDATTSTLAPHPHPHLPTERSILDGVVVPTEAAGPLVSKKRQPIKAPAWLVRFWANRRLRYSAIAAVSLGLAVGGYFALRPVPQPDYANDSMDDVLNYTLLTDEFNRLPIDKRLELLGDLIQRIKTMSSSDSALMAAFAASIDTDRLRRQLEENASRLAMDVWDKYALDYQSKPKEQREAYLDQTLLNMEKMMETVAGVQSDKSDEQRLKEAREQARRDKEHLQKGDGPTGGQLARMADIMRNKVGSHSSPQQQQRGMQLMRDMTRHLRGQDPVTGKPTGGG
jgi:hypothetical protein